MGLASIPSEIITILESRFSGISDFNFASGGCINSGGELITKSGSYFLKWNLKDKFPNMFVAEKEGLELLSVPDGIRIPKAIEAGKAGQYSFLLLEYLSSNKRSKKYWEEFGHGLAAIHSNKADEFGLPYNNYIGSLPQNNSGSLSWSEFFIHRRLLFQLRLAVDTNQIQVSEANRMEATISGLEKRIPDTKPSLVHGDMWSGNLITGPAGEPCLIDPAVYYGHPEMDIAMSMLFGGFDDSYLQAYQEITPLESGYRSRIDLWNLYPLLVHVNLFGGGYLSQVKQILQQYQ